MTDLRGWTPVRVSWVEDGPVVDWCWTEGVTFDDPFFDQTVERCLRDPYRLLFRKQTSIEVLGEWAQESPGLPLAGLVLHLSRCGSTLVSQLLVARGGVRVMAEPGPFDSLLRSPATFDERVQWLRWVASALGQPGPGEQHLVLKLDAWAALDLAVIKAAFPDVPRVFVFRDAVDVLSSHAGHRGFHMIPGALPAQLLEFAAPADLSLEAYGAAVLGAIAGAVVADADDPAWLMVPYEDLPGAVRDVAAHFGLTVSADQAAAMATAARRDAKNPVLEFVADLTPRRAAPTATMVQECAARVDPVIDRLRDRVR